MEKMIEMHLNLWQPSFAEALNWWICYHASVGMLLHEEGSEVQRGRMQQALAQLQEHFPSWIWRTSSIEVCHEYQALPKADILRFSCFVFVCLNCSKVESRPVYRYHWQTCRPYSIVMCSTIESHFQTFSFKCTANMKRRTLEQTVIV